MRDFAKGTALLSAFVTILGCAGEQPQVETAPRPVRTFVVETRTETTPLVLAGVARAGIESNLSFRVSGTVTELPVRVGERVERGRVLGRLDPVDYELGVEEAKAALAQAEAALRRAIADYGRVRGLYENNNAARSELDAGRAAFESAEAQVDAAQKRLAQAQQRVTYTVLRAPVDGAVAAVDVEINETVNGGQTIVRVTSGESPEIEVGVPEVTIPFIEPGMPAAVRFDALPGAGHTGTVTEVGVATTGGASTYPVTVRLDDASGSVRSGMAAEVTLQIGRGDGSSRLVLPAVAVGEDGDGRFVFLVEDGGDGLGTVRRREVTVGKLTSGGIEVLDGVSIGDIVVTAGVRRLTEGTTVRYSPDERSSWM